MTREALSRAWKEAHEHNQRAHVTPYIYQNPGLFKICSVKTHGEYSNHRWTVDTPEDLTFIRTIYKRLDNGTVSGWRDVLKVLSKEPQLTELNRNIQQKVLEEG